MALSMKRTHRPLERLWPYVEKPEEPTAEELACVPAPSDVDVTLSGKTSVSPIRMPGRVV